MEGGRLEAQKRRWKIGLNDWIGLDFYEFYREEEMNKGKSE